MDTTKTITHIGLCAGYGGIELGLGRVIPTLRSVALCEIEAFPIANLVAKMEAGLMDSAPVWTDLKSFPWESFRDRVDILTGGYPCQPFSAAGKRAGKDDPRHLWPWIADGIRILRPRMCFFENVEGHISLGLSSVISDLEELGYKVSWGIFSAREVGAPHQRKRVFILAYDNGKRLEGMRQCCDTQGWEAPIGQAGSCGDVWPSRPGEPQHDWEPPRVVGNADHGRLTPSIYSRSSEETDRGGQGDIEQAESGQTQPSLGRDPHGLADWVDYAELYTTCDNRTDELRLLGNGVVPATAERAFRTLLKDITCQN